MDSHQIEILRKIVRERLFALFLCGIGSIVLSLLLLAGTYTLILIIIDYFTGLTPVIWITGLVVIIFVLILYPFIADTKKNTIEYDHCIPSDLDELDLLLFESSDGKIMYGSAHVTTGCLMYASFALHLFYLGIRQIRNGIELFHYNFEQIKSIISLLIDDQSLKLEEVVQRSNLNIKDTLKILSLLDIATITNINSQLWVRLTTPAYNTLHGIKEE